MSSKTYHQQDIYELTDMDLQRLADGLGIPGAKLLARRQLQERVADVLRQRGQLEGAPAGDTAGGGAADATTYVQYGAQDGYFDATDQTLAQLVDEVKEEFSMDPAHLRASVNGVHIPREQWGTYRIPKAAEVHFARPGGDKGAQ